ncbi:MAG: hypothetical protein ACRDTE_21995 [Pseudonocardiaceae bacterium]
MSEQERVENTEREAVPDVDGVRAKESDAGSEESGAQTTQRSKVRVLQYSRSDLLI